MTLSLCVPATRIAASLSAFGQKHSGWNGTTMKKGTVGLCAILGIAVTLMSTQTLWAADTAREQRRPPGRCTGHRRTDLFLAGRPEVQPQHPYHGHAAGGLRLPDGVRQEVRPLGRDGHVPARERGDPGLFPGQRPGHLRQAGGRRDRQAHPGGVRGGQSADLRRRGARPTEDGAVPAAGRPLHRLLHAQ